MATSRRLGGEFPADAPLPQFRKAYRSSLPLLPDRRPQPAPEPLLKILQHLRRFAFSEVSDPAPQIPGQFLGHPFDAHTPRPSRQLPNPLLESQYRLRRNPPPWLHPAREAETQKLP